MEIQSKTEHDFKTIAEQLRKPHGNFAMEVGKKMNEGNLLMNKYAIEELKVKTSDNILEIGMGNGFFVKDILSYDQTIKYTGCDFSEIMVKEACSYNEQYIKNGQAQFQVANAEQLPYDHELFDTVFTVNTIYFWDNVKIVLSEIRRVLKEKGVLIISIRQKTIMDNFPFTKFGFNTFSKTDLVDILNQNGFYVDSITEKEEDDLEFFGENLKNEFLIVKATKV